VSYILSCLIF